MHNSAVDFVQVGKSFVKLTRVQKITGSVVVTSELQLKAENREC